MQVAVPVAPQMLAAASLLQLALPTGAAPAPAPAASPDFVAELAKLLTAVQPSVADDSAAVPAGASPEPQPLVTAAPQMAAPVQQAAIPPSAALPMPAQITPGPPSRDIIPIKGQRDASSPRRGAAVRSEPVGEASPAAALAVVTPLAVAAPVAADATPQAVPIASTRQDDAPRPHDGARPLPPPPVATKPDGPKALAPETAPLLQQGVASMPADPTQAAAQPAVTSSAVHAEPATRALPAAPEPAPSPIRLTESPAETSAPTPRPASPAAQLAPALVQMGHAPDGAQRLTLRLDPPELGHVQVRIERPAEAPARVEIVVEKADTLTLLLRDQPQLQRALDQAGVPPEGRSVTFHVAPPEPPAPRGDQGPAPAPGMAAGGLNGDGSHHASRQGGQQARQQSGMADPSDTEFTPIALTGWVRGGLNITA